MAFQLSPGVLVVEKDLTNIIPAVATSIGGFVGDFVWGPAFQPITLGSELELIKRFGKPTNDQSVFTSFFSAANFLSYSNNLLTIRAVGDDARNATTGSEAVQILNEDQWENEYSDGSAAANIGAFAAKFPGTLGNSLLVSMADKDTFAAWAYRAEFDGAPGTSEFAQANGGENDELHIIVIDEDGVVTGTPGSVLEKYPFVSKAVDAKAPQGGSLYYPNVLRGSRYINWMNHPTQVGAEVQFNDGFSIAALDEDFIVDGDVTDEIVAGDTVAVRVGGVVTTVGVVATVTYDSGDDETTVDLVAPAPANLTGLLVIQKASSVAFGTGASNSLFKSLATAFEVSMTGGVDDTPTDGEIRQGYDLLSNAELLDVNLLIMGAHSLSTAKYVIENIAQTRMDCVVFCSPSFNSVVNNVGDEADDIIAERTNALFNVNSSYGVMDSGWKYQYDKYNDLFRWIPLNADVAGLCARTDATNDPWWSPGGLNRGQIKNVVKLAFTPTKTERDNLYKNGINPVVSFPGEGTCLWGDKTLLAKPSAFDRINVRRLFIVLEKAIATAAKYQLFEFNDAFTRSQFRNMVEPFLRDVQGRRGIFDFRVVCDTTNNTGEVIDRNEFVADIYIKPARSINFITLSFVATRTGVAFDEVVGA
jgi:phage tail sheath protein FI